MRQIGSVALIGLGAIGSAYAERLQAVEGLEFTVVAGGARAARLKKDGAVINGKRCFFNVGDKGGPVDLIIFSTKFHQLEQAIKDVKSFVGPNTLLLSLLNGISGEEHIGAAYGTGNVLYGRCVGIDGVREASGVRFSSLGYIQFGRLKNDPASHEVRAVAALFERAGISYDIPADMERAMWWKYMVNVGINQVSAVLNAPYRVFNEVPEARALMRDTMAEVVALSQKAGVGLEYTDMDALDGIVKNLAPDGKTSMLQDMQAGRKTEVELFSGAVIELGKKLGVPTPMNEVLNRMIVAKEKAARLDS